MDPLEIARQIQGAVLAATRPIAATMRAMIGRAALKAIAEANGLRLVQVQVREGELRDRVEHFEPYGFTGYAPPGAEAIVAHVQAVSGHPVVLVIADRRYRPKDLLEGEVAVFSKFAQLFKLDKDGNAILSAPGNIVLNAGGDVLANAEGKFEANAEGEARLHGSTRTIVECEGHGSELLPDRENTWTIGAVPGAANPINPPRIP